MNESILLVSIVAVPRVGFSDVGKTSFSQCFVVLLHSLFYFLQSRFCAVERSYSFLGKMYNLFRT